MTPDTHTIARRRRRRALAALLIAVLGASAAAWAYWSAPSKGSASGHVASLEAPGISGATPGAGTVALSWSAVTAPAGGAVSYYVSRDGGAPSAACPSSASPAAQTSCTDTGVPVGNHSYTVTAVWRSWTATSTSASAQVLTGAATHLVLTATTSTPTAGSADNLTITAKDASNNTVTSYAGAKSVTFGGASTTGSFHPTVSSESGTATSFGTAETIHFTNGVATTSGASNGAMTLYKAETASITVTDGTLSNGTGTSVKVGAATASSFTVPTPSTQTAGGAFNQTLTALDAYGNTATGYEGSKTIAFSGPATSPGGKAPSYPASVSFTAGISTSFSVTLYNASTTTAIAAKEGTSVSGSSGTFTVNPASATSLSVPTPATQTAGSAFSVTLTAKDSYGNIATGYEGSKSVSFSGPGTSPGGKAPSYPTHAGFSEGSATASITLYKAESPTLTVTAEGGLTTKTTAFTVAAAEASTFTVPTPSTQTAGTAFNVTLTAKDSYGNTATSYVGNRAVTFSGPLTSPDGHAPKYPALVDFGSGEGTASITIYDAGSTTLTAQEGGVSGKTTTSFTVSGLTTTKEFGLSTPSPTAGVPFTETVTAEDEYGNTTTGYTGSHTLAFSGPSKSPNFTSPKYPSGSTTFTAGVATTGSITLYDAQTTTLKVSASGIEGESESFTVASSSPVSLSVTAPGAQTAGVAFALTITGAKDTYGNAVSGTQTVSFANPSSAPDGTAPTYPSSATFSGGEAKPSVTLTDAQTTSIKVTSGTGSATTSSFTVSPAAMTALSLSAASSAPVAGEGDELTIKAVDTYENTVTSYTGSKTLKFGGAAVSGSKHPTVTNSSGSAVEFGSPTAITFTSGASKVSGTSNGVMKLYAAETANVTVSDGTFGNGTGLPITVEGAQISGLSLVNTNFGSSSKGKIEAGDDFTVEFGTPIAVNSMCSTWSGNSSNHSMTNNSEVTVTVSDGTTTDDMLSVSSTACTLHLGTIDLGSSAYVSGGSATFGGSGSNKSTVEYEASSRVLKVKLGTKGGAGTVGKVTSSVATFTPDPSLTDEFGNAFPAFATAATTQF